MSNRLLINKTMDLDDLKSVKALVVIKELNSLIKELKDRDLGISSLYGLIGKHRQTETINRGYRYRSLQGAVDDDNFPWFLYWEIVWVVINNEFMQGQKVLDLGGSSSLFSYYLSSKGLDVTTIDLQRDLVDNANYVAGEMGWELDNYVMDIRKLEFDTKFDHITSICVFEHVPIYDRITVNKTVKNILVKGGTLSLTFDYRNPSRLASINSPEDVYRQFILPSDLQIRGNKVFIDNGKNYLLQPFFYNKRLWKYKIYWILKGLYGPTELFKIKDANDYTFGALFLEKV